MRTLLAPRAVLLAGVVTLLGAAVALPATTAVAAPSSGTAGTAGMTPNPPPLPAILPDGKAPQTAGLNSSSCSSTSFCVAVGYVTGPNDGDYFGLIETYDGSTWTPSVAPTPANASTDFYTSVLTSVSCPVDGSCAAVGVYDDWNASKNDNYQSGLLETLSSGTWTAQEGTSPDGPDSGLVNMNGVSCSAASTCVAVGVDSVGPPAGSLPLVYTLVSGTWALQSGIPLPSNYQNDLDLAAVSCPDTSDCVVVGSYGPTSKGLILTLASGSWSVQESPLPSNASSAPQATGLHVLDTVDCVDAADCVAAGGFIDTSGNQDPMFVTLQSGTWTATEAPVPSDSQADTLALVTGVSCPSVGACVADGYYWTNYLAGDESGMLLTQSGSSWSVASAPLPPSASANKTHSGKGGRKAGKAALNGVSCASAKMCVAVGSDRGRPLIERVKPKQHR